GTDGDANNIGDNEVPADAGDVPVGAPVRSLAAGRYHTCALLQNGKVRCWGFGGQLALGNQSFQVYGDNEPASQSPLTAVLAPSRPRCACFAARFRSFNRASTARVLASQGLAPRLDSRDGPDSIRAESPTYRPAPVRARRRMATRPLGRHDGALGEPAPAARA